MEAKLTLWKIPTYTSSWLLLCLDLDDEELSKEFLGLVVETWITIRGFSMTRAWVEYYKQSMQMSTKEKQGLRKGLKLIVNRWRKVWTMLIDMYIALYLPPSVLLP